MTVRQIKTGPKPNKDDGTPDKRRRGKKIQNKKLWEATEDIDNKMIL
jgi:hypothetical protein